MGANLKRALHERTQPLRYRFSRHAIVEPVERAIENLPLMPPYAARNFGYRVHTDQLLS